MTARGGAGDDLRFDFAPGRVPSRLGVAVSGGSDSLALLHLMHAGLETELSCVTVNHGLRPEAASEALHVARLCEAIGVAHDVLDWGGWDGKGNLQDEARRNRYRLIADWAREREIAHVAIGHTADDLAETFLMRLARAPGVDGLAGMRPRFAHGGVTFHRPLLHRRRADLRRFLDGLGLRWVDDPSNADEAFDRVRARRTLELLEADGLGAETLAKVAGNLRAAREALAATASDWALGHARVKGGDLVFDRTALCRLPPELMRRVVSGALQWVGSAEYPPRRQPMAALLDAIRGAGPGGNPTLHGCLVMISNVTVRITREAAAVAETRAPAPGMWDGRWRIEGPGAPGLEVRALGAALKDCAHWRETGLPRQSLLASPSVWRGDALVAAPLAGLERGWGAVGPEQEDFAAFLILH